MVRVIGVASGKGGVGKTTVVTNLAIALHQLGKKTLIVDCNISTPHLAYYLGASDYKYTINDAVLGNVDITSAVNVKDGIRYVPASLHLNDLVNLDMSSLKKHLKKLSSEKYDFIILDAAPGLGREALVVLDAADEVIFVTTPYAPMVNDVIRSADVLKVMKGAKNLNIVMNMTSQAPHEITSESVQEVTGIPVIGNISYDKNVVYSLVTKLPLMHYRPSSTAGENFKELAANLIGEEYRKPGKLKIGSMIKALKNQLLPARIRMPSEPEDVRNDIFIQGN